jgi:hypothetical protein
VNAVLEVERLEAREHMLVHGDGMARRVVFEASIDEEVEIFELQTVRHNKGGMCPLIYNIPTLNNVTLHHQ